MKEEQLLAYLKANCFGRKKSQTRGQLQRTLGLSKDQLTKRRIFADHVSGRF